MLLFHLLKAEEKNKHNMEKILLLKQAWARSKQQNLEAF